MTPCTFASLGSVTPNFKTIKKKMIKKQNDKSKYARAISKIHPPLHVLEYELLPSYLSKPLFAYSATSPIQCGQSFENKNLEI